jgi:hypothetical protein
MTGTPGATALAALDADDFSTLVRASLGKDASPALWDALTDPLVIGRARDTLGSLHADVQNQLNLANEDLQQARAAGHAAGEAGKETYFAARAEQGEWRRRAIFFRRLVEQRLAFVKARTPRPEQRPAGARAARLQYQDALERLARAVASHRDKVLSGEGGEGDDDTLWDFLDDITVTTVKGGEMPLAKWLDFLDEVRENDE